MGEWKTIEPDMWKPEKEGDFIEGKLVRKEPSNLEANMSARYYLDTGDKTALVWGCAMLDDRMSFINIGEKIKVTYKGKKDIGKGKTLNVYKVDVWKEQKQTTDFAPIVGSPEQPQQTRS